MTRLEEIRAEIARLEAAFEAMGDQMDDLLPFKGV